MHDLVALLDSNVFRTILAILAIAVTITIYRLNKKKKELSYDIARNARLFRLDEELRTRVQVTLDGERVNDLSLAIIDIANTGNEPIQREEFDKPFTLRFGNDAKIISARVLGTKPNDLEANLSVTGGDVVLQPLLLNKGDGMTIEVLTAESSAKILHSARIVGIPEVKPSIRLPLNSREKISRLLLLIAGVFALGLVCITTALQYRRNFWYFSRRIDMTLLVVTTILGVIVGLSLAQSHEAKRSGDI